METMKLKSINLKGGYRIELSINRQGLPVASSFRVLSSGKNKGHLKRMESYYFKTEQRREEWIKELITKITNRLQREAQEKELKKSIRENMKHPYQVGQILYTSWGYDQTNVNFYQITEVGEKSIKLREICGESVSITSSDSDRVKPTKDSFRGEEFKKKVGFYVSDNKPRFYVKISDTRTAFIYDSGDHGVHRSWGY